MIRYPYKTHQKTFQTYSDTYSFGPGNVFEMHLADNPEKKHRCLNLVRRIYSERGYHSARSGRTDAFDAVDGAATFLVTAHGRPAGTLRIIPDSPRELPMDSIYPDLLAPLRSQNTAICEIASMAIDTSYSGDTMPVLLELFRLAWLTARHILGASDMLASVMAHHVHFYRKRLLFDEVSPAPRISPRTGCPVNFCRLDLPLAENRYRAHYTRRKGGKNLYDFFFTDKLLSEREFWLYQHLLPHTGTLSGTFNTTVRRKACSATAKPLLVMSAS